jgi:hypothetical protein
MRNIDKDKYFEISQQSNLPKRCPILTSCERRAYTRYISEKRNFQITFDDFKKNEMKEGNLDIKIVPQQGELATFAGGSNNWGLSRICPEVSLFESELVPFSPRGLAVTSASYDKYFESSDKTIIHETGHFSECVEFIKYVATKDSKVTPDILELKPTWFGIKLDLNALFRKIFKRVK